jgi:hypothetical protein
LASIFNTPAARQTRTGSSATKQLSGSKFAPHGKILFGDIPAIIDRLNIIFNIVFKNASRRF